jgi:hypothetical protein
MAEINKVAIVHLNLDGYREERVFLYVALIGHYNIILGMPWVIAQDVRINRPRLELWIGGIYGIYVKSRNEML